MAQLRYQCFPDGSVGKEPACNAGDLGSIPGLGRSSGEGKGYPLQYSGLENSSDCSPWSHKESDMTEHMYTMTIITLACVFEISIYVFSVS